MKAAITSQSRRVSGFFNASFDIVILVGKKDRCRVLFSSRTLMEKVKPFLPDDYEPTKFAGHHMIAAKDSDDIISRLEYIEVEIVDSRPVEVKD